jgi:hypothetical protein
MPGEALEGLGGDRSSVQAAAYAAEEHAPRIGLAGSSAVPIARAERADFRPGAMERRLELDRGKKRAPSASNSRA